jgi:hypothetical protein
VFVLAFLFAPKRGLVSIWSRRYPGTENPAASPGLPN